MYPDTCKYTYADYCFEYTCLYICLGLCVSSSPNPLSVYYPSPLNIHLSHSLLLCVTLPPSLSAWAATPLSLSHCLRLSLFAAPSLALSRYCSLPSSLPSPPCLPISSGYSCVISACLPLSVSFRLSPSVFPPCMCQYLRPVLSVIARSRCSTARADVITHVLLSSVAPGAEQPRYISHCRPLFPQSPTE